MQPTATTVRSIAVIEGAKGVLVILAGLGLLGLLHHDVQAIAEALVRDAHLNPASHLPRLLLEASGKVDDHRILFLVRFAMAYGALRLAEAYGLWHLRPWGEWLGALVGGLYLPFEVRLIIHRFTMLHLLVFIGNLLIVGFLVWQIVRRRRRERISRLEAEGIAGADG
jgi:uncharacterized membrane protein (DUF2068 family)